MNEAGGSPTGCLGERPMTLSSSVEAA
jgi:hypothetical protein